jgi:hypothetical protein
MLVGYKAMAAAVPAVVVVVPSFTITTFPWSSSSSSSWD